MQTGREIIEEFHISKLGDYCVSQTMIALCLLKPAHAVKRECSVELDVFLYATLLSARQWSVVEASCVSSKRLYECSLWGGVCSSGTGMLCSHSFHLLMPTFKSHANSTIKLAVSQRTRLICFLCPRFFVLLYRATRPGQHYVANNIFQWSQAFIALCDSELGQAKQQCA